AANATSTMLARTTSTRWISRRGTCREATGSTVLTTPLGVTPARAGAHPEMSPRAARCRVGHLRMGPRLRGDDTVGVELSGFARGEGDPVLAENSVLPRPLRERVVLARRETGEGRTLRLHALHLRKHRPRHRLHLLRRQRSDHRAGDAPV